MCVRITWEKCNKRRVFLETKARISHPDPKMHVREYGQKRKHMRSPACARAHTHTHARAHTHTHTHTHARARTHTHTHSRARIHTNKQAHAHAHTDTHTCTQTYTRRQKHTHTHTHTHTRYDLLRQRLLDNPNVRNLCSDGTINNNYRPSDFLQLDKAQILLAEYVYNCMSLRIWVLMFPSQQLYQKTLYYQQEYCTISKYGSYLCSLMLILFLSLTLPGLTDASSHTARETHHRESRRSRRDSGTTAEQPDDLNTHHWPREKHRSRAFVSFAPFR